MNILFSKQFPLCVFGFRQTHISVLFRLNSVFFPSAFASGLTLFVLSCLSVPFRSLFPFLSFRLFWTLLSFLPLSLPSLLALFFPPVYSLSLSLLISSFGFCLFVFPLWSLFVFFRFGFPVRLLTFAFFFQVFRLPFVPLRFLSASLCSDFFLPFHSDFSSLSFRFFASSIYSRVFFFFPSPHKWHAFLFLLLRFLFAIPTVSCRRCRLVGSSGVEPPTSCLSGMRSNLLSYEPLLLAQPRSTFDLRSNSYEPRFRFFNRWWRWRESNPWPPACRAGALPTELHPRIWGKK